MEEKEGKNSEQEEIFAKAVRAGKRTYFFDIRATRGNDYYLTITESKRQYNEDGTFQYQKHKIFLYKEDFEKFGTALAESFQKVIELKKEQDDQFASKMNKDFTDVRFEELDDQNEKD
ncbi:MAG TPA: DNA-binding protein [Flavobacteriales bacterium]|jgi:hypothetical protein|nr:DNA-binding protein [Flavobacteriales bacterium]